MDIKRNSKFIKFVAKSGASEVKLEMEDIKITSKQVLKKQKQHCTSSTMATMLKWQLPVAPAAAPVAAPAAPAAQADEDQVHHY